MEKRNIITGFWMLLLFSLVGSLLEVWLGRTNFITPEGMGSVRAALKTAHSHALCLSFANILFGLSADVLIKSGKLRTISSWLIMVGSIGFPLAFIGEVFINESLVFIAPVSGVLFISGLLITLVGRLARNK